jgi:hypothetical protein
MEAATGVDIADRIIARAEVLGRKERPARLGVSPGSAPAKKKRTKKPGRGKPAQKPARRVAGVK